ncbi:polysaccharide biosynthesis protein [Ruminococcus albus]|uniref:NDP-sugar epimerase, includes UDP-GlcNAc-inverting 4,6-dehydratase FlaA1 and capsular polysaccharide biosynthesis protein EpsC n=1 Tax=Ruminococcus albus TaxID=1264 RepID=A0A1I1MUB9_RUMAL|nr:nucleoside-diphosphate sugar epimerase/dehydratase [Ruminococcus albus]SFC86173.1 NDP-sugar epimerase, includes UDP-GlcNAc-inverting 4,6-dehydratase FlaA1 and capsular polysaccharide biosynthesis protein EpsC [Ruminococcus albus]
MADESEIVKKVKLRSKKRFEHWQIISIYLFLYDIIVSTGSYFAGLWLRYDLSFTKIPRDYLNAYMYFMPIYVVAVFLVHGYNKLYRSIWRFASYSELKRVTFASAELALIHTVLITVIFRRMPISYYIVGPMLQFCFIIGIRFCYRFILLERERVSDHGKDNDRRCKRVMLIGAGNAGQMIMRDIEQSTTLREKVVCIIDDNPNKWDRYIDGVKIVGGRDDILLSVQKYNVNAIYVAIPSASPEDRREVLNICKETGCELKNLPGIYQLVTGDVSVAKMKDVAIEDLLGRKPIEMDMSEVYDSIQGKVVLVTGGGGSIGSELCRQVAKHNPKQLIIFDVYENNAYEIQMELRRNMPDLNLVVLIGSVRDNKRINEVFEKYHVDIVYHAAAHKHVPLMEDSPCEAIKNNAIGTYKTAYAAMRSGCQRFVLISTDKAVNPTNIMRASKRLCEMIIQTFDYMVKNGRCSELPRLHAHMTGEDWEADEALENFTPHTQFCAVRFGNVLGSNGSVIPLFKKQIAEGGPVTVVDKNINRFFMSIPEAVSLVLQASILGNGSEIYVLDMGEPIKIDTLARNLIKLSGHKPDVDIKIVYTGLRPGEKLYEEKLMSEEGLKRTKNQKIHIGQPIPFKYDKFIRDIKELMDVAYTEDEYGVYEKVCEVVTTFHPTSAPVKPKLSSSNVKQAVNV